MSKHSKFNKGDTVVVIAGKDKGRKGKIQKVFPRRNALLVEGINTYKRHMKRRDEQNPGGIVERNRPLSTGSVMVLCPSCGKPTRIGFLITRDEKIRICRKCERKL
ncbi:50S ribosomal protein L24 [Patescibacteria group bacterium]|nr:50S ribosomal protein L24 [Patescibacteria group bacterium]